MPKVSLRFLASLLKKTMQSFEKRNRLTMKSLEENRLIAILRLPRTSDCKENFLRSKNKDTEYYMLEIQEAYDIKNDLVLDFQINNMIKT